MSGMPWPELRAAVLALDLSQPQVLVTREGNIIDEKKFIESHVRVIDQFPKKPHLTNSEKNARLFIAKPHYDRLYAYYVLRTQL